MLLHGPAAPATIASTDVFDRETLAIWTSHGHFAEPNVIHAEAAALQTISAAAAPDPEHVIDMINRHEFHELRRPNGTSLGAQYRVFENPDVDFLIKVPMREKHTREKLTERRQKETMSDQEFRTWVQDIHNGKAEGERFAQEDLADSNGIYHVTTFHDVSFIETTDDGPRIHRPARFLAQKKASETLAQAIVRVVQAKRIDLFHALIHAVLHMYAEEIWPFAVFDLDPGFTGNSGVEWVGETPVARLFDFGQFARVDPSPDAFNKLKYTRASFWRNTWVMFSKKHAGSIASLTGSWDLAEWTHSAVITAFNAHRIYKIWGLKAAA